MRRDTNVAELLDVVLLLIRERKRPSKDRRAHTVEAAGAFAAPPLGAVASRRALRVDGRGT